MARAAGRREAVRPAEDGGEYRIDVATVADPVRDCYVATVVVLRLPDMQEVFREEFATAGLQRARPRDLLAAALTSGQQAVRREQCRQGRG